MSATNFNTKNDTYRKLMGNGLTYRFPRFQRDYSWTEEEWEDLWLDILRALEARLTGAVLDFDADSFNLEHVLPENPEAGWDAFSDDEVEALVYRLGNLTLLAKGANKDLANSPHAAKRPVFAASAFGITQKIAEDNADWTPERLAARQNGMANQATAIWRIDQLT